MTTDQFNRFSDAIMGPILEQMAPAERKKLLLGLRKTVHPSAYAWIDAQLESMDADSSIQKKDLKTRGVFRG